MERRSQEVVRAGLSVTLIKALYIWWVASRGAQPPIPGAHAPATRDRLRACVYVLTFFETFFVITERCDPSDSCALPCTVHTVPTWGRAPPARRGRAAALSTPALCARRTPRKDENRNRGRAGYTSVRRHHVHLPLVT